MQQLHDRALAQRVLPLSSIGQALAYMAECWRNLEVLLSEPELDIATTTRPSGRCAASLSAEKCLFVRHRGVARPSCGARDQRSSARAARPRSRGSQGHVRSRALIGRGPATALGVLKWAAEQQAARRLLGRGVVHLGASDVTPAGRVQVLERLNESADIPKRDYSITKLSNEVGHGSSYVNPSNCAIRPFLMAKTKPTPC